VLAEAVGLAFVQGYQFVDAGGAVAKQVGAQHQVSVFAMAEKALIKAAPSGGQHVLYEGKVHHAAAPGGAELGVLKGGALGWVWQPRHYC
jgi:hypothetical protein